MATQQKPGYVRDIVTGIVRIAFPHIQAPSTGGQYPSDKYEVHGLWPKADTATTDALASGALTAARQLWQGINLTELIVGIKDGDEKAKYDGFPGHWFINPKNKDAVPIYGPVREKLESNVIYSGCYCRMMVDAGAYTRSVEPAIAQDLIRAGRKLIETTENGQKKYSMPAVTFYLNALQFVRNGDPMGGGHADPMAFPEEANSGAAPFSAPVATSKDNANPWG